MVVKSFYHTDSSDFVLGDNWYSNVRCRIRFPVCCYEIKKTYFLIFIRMFEIVTGICVPGHTLYFDIQIPLNQWSKNPNTPTRSTILTVRIVTVNEFILTVFDPDMSMRRCRYILVGEMRTVVMSITENEIVDLPPLQAMLRDVRIITQHATMNVSMFVNLFYARTTVAAVGTVVAMALVHLRCGCTMKLDDTICASRAGRAVEMSKDSYSPIAYINEGTRMGNANMLRARKDTVQLYD